MTKDKLSKLKPNTIVEVRFFDHYSDNGNWKDRKEVTDEPELELVLVGYYVGSTRYSHRFSIVYSTKNDHYGPVFSVLKDTVIRWRKLKYPKGHFERR